jgi:hypothetical protein
LTGGPVQAGLISELTSLERREAPKPDRQIDHDDRPADHPDSDVEERAMARGRSDKDRDMEEMEEEELDEEELDETEDMEDMGETCPGCGMDRSEWKGNMGQGVPKDGETYCCQGCADGVDCTCAA